ncbi:hypothetical protein J4G33_06280 [Actinotalea sp. BY-33]|uniref:Uncharacterized protein n=1 Tax=Actinotalea soli TaxID=2819234 RepID=A0A939LN62_9CELL|nr:hypothetical protein [Actinotalea soli]MBO1751407.1 hypothetical protein [Actinotalea soli]
MLRMILAYAFAFGMLGLGLGHYAGRLRFLMRHVQIHRYESLSFAWIGGGLLIPLSAPLVLGIEEPWAAGAVAVMFGTLAVLHASTVAVMSVGVLGLFWMPPFLRPAWMKEARRPSLPPPPEAP